MVDPIPVHVFCSIEPEEGRRVTVFEASNCVRLARGVFFKIEGASKDDHQRIVNIINSVCVEVEAGQRREMFDVAS